MYEIQYFEKSRLATAYDPINTSQRAFIVTTAGLDS